jgi:nitrite reductase/ring-hydroxylating ferredoxin subunit
MSALATAPVKKRISAGLADLADGARRIVDADTFSIGIFRVDGHYHAVRNACPHEGAELCKGKLTGTNLPTDTPGTYNWARENLILRCPWHQWEFDLETGQHLANSACRVRVYQVIEQDGHLFIEV